jgi:hypothetical protein
MEWKWQTPAWKTPVDRADRVELFSLPERDIVPPNGWPHAFWRHVGERILLNEADSQRVIHLFRELEPGESARCHEPPWGLALYAGEALLFTVTLCYMCSNAYVYTGDGKDLRAFNPGGPNAAALRQALEQHLPLSE